MIPIPRPDYEQTIEAIAACGVPAENIRISYEDDLQSDVIFISDLGTADEEGFRCLGQAVHPFYVLLIEDEGQQHAFQTYVDRVERERARVEAIEWLTARRLVARVPSFDSTKGIETFARELEAVCGLTEGRMLEVYGPATLTLRRDYLKTMSKSGAGEDLACVKRYLAASNAHEHGIRFGLIANAAIRDSDQ